MEETEQEKQQKHENIRKIFEAAQSFSREQDASPAAILFVLPDGKFYVLSVLETKADIRRMMIDYLDALGRGGSEVQHIDL